MQIKTYNTLFIGKVLLDFPTLPSTNTHAIDLLAKSTPMEGTVISTPHQAAGKGQYGSSWESEAGKNITLSIILYPTFLAVRHQFMLNKAISLGVFDVLSHYLPADRISVKWPNDLYVDDHKIGGILIQNSLKGSKINSSVVGIGLNINQINFLSDAPNPTSFTLITGQSYPVEDLCLHLCKTIELRYLQLRNKKWESLDTDYLYSLYRLGEYAEFQEANAVKFQGKICGVAEDGKLEVEHKNTGKLKHYYFKEIKFVLE